MRTTAQDISQITERVDGVDGRFTHLLKGLLYLISMRWVIDRAIRGDSISTDGIEAQEVVNEVMSHDRPFAFRAETEATQADMENHLFYLENSRFTTDAFSIHRPFHL